MLELAARIADGVILNLMTPAQAGAAVRVVRTSAQAAGRDPASVEIACVVHCCLGSDSQATAAAAHAAVLRYGYVMHPGRRGCSANWTAARACGACRNWSWRATGPPRPMLCRSRWPTDSSSRAARRSAWPGQASTRRRAWTCRSCFPMPGRRRLGMRQDHRRHGGKDNVTNRNWLRAARSSGEVLITSVRSQGLIQFCRGMRRRASWR